MDQSPNLGYIEFGKSTQPPKVTPTFGQTVSAHFGYNYDPIHEALYNEYVIGTEYDPDYNPLEDLEGYEIYHQHLLSAQNAEHMASLKRGIDENEARRKIIGDAGLGKNLMAGFFDPVNLLALPFGGPGIGLIRSGVRVGLGVGATQVAQEALRAPFDPLSTQEEVALNVGMATAGGFVLGGLFSIPVTRRSRAMNNLLKQMDEASSASKNVVAHTIKSDGTIVIKKKPESNTKNVEKPKAEKVAYVDKDHNLRRNDTDEILKDTSTEKTIEVKIDDAYGMARSWFTDSWLYQVISTPMKRALQNENLPDRVKMMFVQLAGDSGVKLNMHKYGIAIDPSVYQKAKMRDGEWVVVYDKLMKAFTSDTNKKVLNPVGFDYNLTNNKAFVKWLEEAELRRLTDNVGPTEYHPHSASPSTKKAMELMDVYWNRWRLRLDDVGMLGGKRYLQNQIRFTENKIKKKEAYLQATMRNNKKDLKAEKQLKELKLKHDIYTKRLKEGDTGTGKYLPRYWSLSKIAKNPTGLEKILVDWYTKNPVTNMQINQKTGNRFTDKEIAGINNPDNILERAKEVVKALRGLNDPFDIEVQDIVPNIMYAGFIEKSSKHIKSRELDIPNHLVWEFIETNPVSVMKAYTGKIAPQYEFNSKFLGTTSRQKNNYGVSLEDVLDDITEEIINKGLSAKTAQRVRRDFVSLYDRVTKSVVKEPHAFNQKATRVLKDWTTLRYLGAAGFSTLPDYAKIIMEHELGTILKTAVGFLKDNRVKLNNSEARISGEALEILLGDSHLRFSDDMMNNPFGDGFYAKGMDKVKQGFFFLNGLAPLTNIAKRLDGIMRAHTIIDYSVKVKDGSSTKFQREWLARNNISQKMIEFLGDQKKAPWQKTDSGLYLANSKAWEKKVPDDVIEGFRSSMNSGIMNTILMSTPADKPIAMDGIFYIPHRIGRLVGMREDNRVKGYSRIENGLLSLPFQFLSYSFAAANKITASYAQRTVTNPISGLIAAMGLGYMTLELKYWAYPYLLDEMSWEDTIARSFDASGLAALHSDMAYSVLNNSIALGFLDKDDSYISPKYDVPTEGIQRDVDVASQWLGPAPGLIADVAIGLKQLHDEDYAEGSETLLNTVPFRSLMWTRGLFGELNRHVRNNF